MIQPQILMTLEDRDRHIRSVLVARDLPCFQYYQVALVDAFVGMSDYLPEYPRVIVPTEFLGESIVFTDTFFLPELNIPAPNALILCSEALDLFFRTFETTTSNNVLNTSDIIDYICLPERMKPLQQDNSLQLVGVFVPLPEPPAQPPAHLPVEQSPETEEEPQE